MSLLVEKKIIVTGANGLLGSSFCNFSKYKNIIGCSKESLDIISLKSLHKILDKEKPDIILHTAAYTNVEKCEINPEKSYEVNVLGTKNIVDYCSKNNIFLIILSFFALTGFLVVTYLDMPAPDKLQTKVLDVNDDKIR